MSLEKDHISPDVIREATETMVSLPRIRFLEEDEDTLEVEFGEQTYTIAKRGNVEFTGGSSISNGTVTPRLALRLKQSIVLRVDLGILIDAGVPKEFWEPMIVHEIREMEYAEHGLADKHERALQDELLYVLKHFDLDLQTRYLQFAKEYRAFEIEMINRGVEKYDGEYHLFDQTTKDGKRLLITARSKGDIELKVEISNGTEQDRAFLERRFPGITVDSEYPNTISGTQVLPFNGVDRAIAITQEWEKYIYLFLTEEHLGLTVGDIWMPTNDGIHTRILQLDPDVVAPYLEARTRLAAAMREFLGIDIAEPPGALDRTTQVTANIADDWLSYRAERRTLSLIAMSAA